MSHGLVPVLFPSEIKILEYSLSLPRTAEEFWIGAVEKDGKSVWGEGSRIDDYMWEGDQTCPFPHCGVTVNSGLRGIKLRVRNVEDKYRNLCPLWIPNETVLLRLARLWQYLNSDDRVTLTKSLPSQMIRVNSQRIQDLEQKVLGISDKLRITPAIL